MDTVSPGRSLVITMISPTVPVEYAKIRSYKPIVFITVTQNWPKTCRLWDQDITRKYGLTNSIWSLQQSTPLVRFHIIFKWGICVCDKSIPAHMYLYCNLSRNWHWHYMGFVSVGPWHCACKSIVLPHIHCDIQLYLSKSFLQTTFANVFTRLRHFQWWKQYH